MITSLWSLAGKLLMWPRVFLVFLAAQAQFAGNPASSQHSCCPVCSITILFTFALTVFCKVAAGLSFRLPRCLWMAALLNCINSFPNAASPAKFMNMHCLLPPCHQQSVPKYHLYVPRILLVLFIVTTTISAVLWNIHFCCYTSKNKSSYWLNCKRIKNLCRRACFS